jgi:hypothetical protein
MRSRPADACAARFFAPAMIFGRAFCGRLAADRGAGGQHLLLVDAVALLASHLLARGRLGLAGGRLLGLVRGAPRRVRPPNVDSALPYSSAVSSISSSSAVSWLTTMSAPRQLRTSS